MLSIHFCLSKETALSISSVKYKRGGITDLHQLHTHRFNWVSKVRTQCWDCIALDLVIENRPPDPTNRNHNRQKMLSAIRHRYQSGDNRKWSTPTRVVFHSFIQRGTDCGRRNVNDRILEGSLKSPSDGSSGCWVGRSLLQATSAWVHVLHIGSVRFRPLYYAPYFVFF